jgi:acyl carrier protein
LESEEEPLAARVETILAQVLGVAESTLEDLSGPAQVPAWDSLAQLDIVVSIEAEYKVRFAPEEIPELLSVESLKRALRAKGADPG